MDSRNTHSAWFVSRAEQPDSCRDTDYIVTNAPGSYSTEGLKIVTWQICHWPLTPSPPAVASVRLSR
jgi:hypothetical protein